MKQQIEPEGKEENIQTKSKHWDWWSEICRNLHGLPFLRSLNWTREIGFITLVKWKELCGERVTTLQKQTRIQRESVYDNEQISTSWCLAGHITMCCDDVVPVHLVGQRSKPQLSRRPRCVWGRAGLLCKRIRAERNPLTEQQWGHWKEGGPENAIYESRNTVAMSTYNKQLQGLHHLGTITNLKRLNFEVFAL